MKPILFSTPMVEAILEERKTMTRRVVTRKGYNDQIHQAKNDFARHEYEDLWQIGYKSPNRMFPQESIGVNPRYNPGDILWVRETWRLIDFEHIDGDWNASVQYKADSTIGARIHCLKSGADERTGWRPSIFMPKEAARIFLRVIDVRAERLLDIPYEDCYKEGIQLLCDGVPYKENSLAYENFICLWDEINGKRNGGIYASGMDPWVWVYSFERCEKPGGME